MDGKSNTSRAGSAESPFDEGTPVVVTFDPFGYHMLMQGVAQAAFVVLIDDDILLMRNGPPGRAWELNLGGAMIQEVIWETGETLYYPVRWMRAIEDPDAEPISQDQSEDQPA